MGAKAAVHGFDANIVFRIVGGLRLPFQSPPLFLQFPFALVHIFFEHRRPSGMWPETASRKSYGYTTLIDLVASFSQELNAFRHEPLHPDLYDCNPSTPFANGYPMS
jgi:hypothetical protein